MRPPPRAAASVAHAASAARVASRTAVSIWNRSARYIASACGTREDTSAPVSRGTHVTQRRRSPASLRIGKVDNDAGALRLQLRHVATGGLTQPPARADCGHPRVEPVDANPRDLDRLRVVE
ncbi:hypothetical protein [Novosphingobium sp. CECT 9465]|uniref:hypothetical protein n=1 Tax=Novosphingobium sp. CECT 9465 TaxID=2829794 RepID=UPI001E3D158F|nr:hypothetical protein [Novosphingobium sp. CECT 9465]